MSKKPLHRLLKWSEEAHKRMDLDWLTGEEGSFKAVHEYNRKHSVKGAKRREMWLKKKEEGSTKCAECGVYIHDKAWDELLNHDEVGILYEDGRFVCPVCHMQLSYHIALSDGPAARRFTSPDMRTPIMYGPMTDGMTVIPMVKVDNASGEEKHEAIVMLLDNCKPATDPETGKDITLYDTTKNHTQLSDGEGEGDPFIRGAIVLRKEQMAAMAISFLKMCHLMSNEGTMDADMEGLLASLVAECMGQHKARTAILKAVVDNIGNPPDHIKEALNKMEVTDEIREVLDRMKQRNEAKKKEQFEDVFNDNPFEKKKGGGGGETIH